MKRWCYRITQVILCCCLAAVLPALAQDNHPQSNEHPEHQKQEKPEHRTQKPSANQHHAAHPAEHNTAHPQPQSHRTTNNRPARTEHPQSNHAARPAQNHAPQHQANRGHRPAQWGKPPAHRGSYSFRSNDRSRLHSYYMSRFGAINRANRPVFRVGGYFPYADIEYISPLPPELYGTLPPPPPGYEIGYYDGYVVVYDPVTYFIVSVIDLLQ